MTIKKLSPEIPLEHDYEGRFKDKLWCYAAVILHDTIEDDRWGLGIAVADEPGYHPISGLYAHASTFEEAMDHADDLNLERSIPRMQGAMIIASTMCALPRFMPERRRA